MARFDLAEELLERYGVDELLNFRTLVQHSKTYLQFLEQTFQPTQIYRKYPIQHYHQGRLFEKIIDLILHTPQGLVLIQNSGFASEGNGKQWKNKALALSSWLYLASEGIHQVFKEDRIRCFINFPMGGGMVEIALNKIALKS